MEEQIFLISGNWEPTEDGYSIFEALWLDTAVGTAIDRVLTGKATHCYATILRGKTISLNPSEGILVAYRKLESPHLRHDRDVFGIDISGAARLVDDGFKAIRMGVKTQDPHVCGYRWEAMPDYNLSIDFEVVAVREAIAERFNHGEYDHDCVAKMLCSMICEKHGWVCGFMVE